jgi:hypothetical protein
MLIAASSSHVCALPVTAVCAPILAVKAAGVCYDACQDAQPHNLWLEPFPHPLLSV